MNTEIRGHQNWPRLAAGTVVTAVVALSVHSVLLQGLQVPFPDLSVIPPSGKFLIRTASMLGLVFLAQLMPENLQASFFKRWAVLFLIDAMLTETLIRAPFMEGYCTTAWTFAFVSNLPKIFTLALGSALALLAALRLVRPWQKIAAAVVITGLTSYVVTPLVGMAMQPVMAGIAHLAPQGEWCGLPYGANVLIPAYLTFVEPASACLAAVALAWDRLSASRPTRYVQFILLILAIKNQLLAPFVYAAFAQLDLLPALISEGQFALEAAALALLTAFTWEWAHRSAAREPM